uniref:Trigger factor ribosome-binding bacterial domain-containing protein n=1 Tax=Lotharella globosa TaxID=91324 RepID=A0A7S3ZA96_9EUKA
MAASVGYLSQPRTTARAWRAQLRPVLTGVCLASTMLFLFSHARAPPSLSHSAFGRCGSLRVQTTPKVAWHQGHRSLWTTRAVESAEDTAAQERELKNGVRIKTSRESDCTLRLDVTIPTKTCRKTLNSVVKKLGENVTVPGFRKTIKKSQIPQDLIIGAIGRNVVEQTAIEQLIQKTVWDALDEVKDQALPKSEQIRLHDKARSVVDHIKSEEEFKYMVTVEVIPDVKWEPHYSQLSVQMPIADPEKHFAVKQRQIQKKFGEEVAVDPPTRGFTPGDVAIVSYKFKQTEENGGGPIFAAIGADIPLVMHRRIDGSEVQAVRYDAEEVELMPGIGEAILGMQEDEEKTVTVRIPEEWDVASVSGVDAEVTLKIEMLRNIVLKPLDDGLAPWLASGAINLQDALVKGVKESKLTLAEEEGQALEDAVTAAVAGAVASELPKRLIFQTAVNLYMDSLPKTRGTTQNIESAPTLVERYIDSNRYKVETTARARMGLRAIADSEGLVADEALVRERAKQARAQKKANPVTAGKVEGKEEEKLEDSKEWSSAKYAIEMDMAFDWLKKHVVIERI